MFDFKLAFSAYLHTNNDTSLVLSEFSLNLFLVDQVVETISISPTLASRQQFFTLQKLSNDSEHKKEPYRAECCVSSMFCEPVYYTVEQMFNLGFPHFFARRHLERI